MISRTPCQRTLASSSLSDTAKGSLTKYYHGLDPVDLLKSMEMLQDKLWKYGFVALPVNAPITAQSLIPKTDDRVEDNQSMEKEKQKVTPSETPPGDRFYRSSKNTKRPRAIRSWRTRKDPFEAVWDGIRRKLELNPLLNATQILSALMLQEPQNFKQSHCRTLQRRVKTWRIEQDHHESIMRQLLLPDQTQTEEPDVILPSQTDEKVVRF